MQEKIAEHALSATPDNGLAYGLLVVLLLGAVGILWRYLDKTLEQHRKESKEVIDRNTEAFNSFKAESADDKKKNEVTIISVDRLVEQIGKLIAVHEHQSSMIEKQWSLLSDLPRGMEAVNEGMGVLAELMLDENSADDPRKKAIRDTVHRMRRTPKP